MKPSNKGNKKETNKKSNSQKQSVTPTESNEGRKYTNEPVEEEKEEKKNRLIDRTDNERQYINTDEEGELDDENLFMV